MFLIYKAISILLASLSIQYGTASVFWADGDPSNPDSSNACHHRAVKIPRKLDDKGSWIAHKTLPCGAVVLLINPRTGKFTIARKSDWGPVNAMVDLSRKVEHDLEHNGLEPVILIPLS